MTVPLNGTSQATATTGPGGAYSFAGLVAGSYSLQPALSGCAFAPNVVNLNNLTTNAK